MSRCKAFTGLVGVLLVVSVGSACNVFEPNALRSDTITVVNLTDEPITVLAVDRDLASRLDINPTFPIDRDSDRIVSPGRSIELSADDVLDFAPGNDVVFFLYSVQVEEATIRGFLLVTGSELRDQDHRLDVHALPFPPHQGTP